MKARPAADCVTANMSYSPQMATAGTNLYAWCGNDPVNMVDPSSMWSFAGLRARIGVFNGVVADLDNAGGDQQVPEGACVAGLLWLKIDGHFPGIILAPKKYSSAFLV